MMDLRELHDIMYGEQDKPAPQPRVDADADPLPRIHGELHAILSVMQQLRDEVAALTALWLENQPKPKAPPKHGDPAAPLTWLKVEQLFARYGDEDTPDLAREVGVTRNKLGYWFRAYAQRAGRKEEYREKLRKIYSRRATTAHRRQRSKAA